MTVIEKRLAALEQRQRRAGLVITPEERAEIDAANLLYTITDYAEKIAKARPPRLRSAGGPTPEIARRAYAEYEAQVRERLRGDQGALLDALEASDDQAETLRAWADEAPRLGVNCVILMEAVSGYAYLHRNIMYHRKMSKHQNPEVTWSLWPYLDAERTAEDLERWQVMCRRLVYALYEPG
jgi:hypothetical protein